MRKTAETRADQTKRPRRPFIGDTRDILTVQGKDPNYEYRWVNDDRGRVQRMIEAGYDVVQDEGLVIGSNQDKDPGTGYSVPVNKLGTKGVLMKIRKEYAEEDRKARAQDIKKREEALFRSERNADGRYGTLEKE